MTGSLIIVGLGPGNRRHGDAGSVAGPCRCHRCCRLYPLCRPHRPAPRPDPAPLRQPGRNWTAPPMLCKWRCKVKGLWSSPQVIPASLPWPRRCSRRRGQPGLCRAGHHASCPASPRCWRRRRRLARPWAMTSAPSTCRTTSSPGPSLKTACATPRRPISPWRSTIRALPAGPKLLPSPGPFARGMRTGPPDQLCPRRLDPGPAHHHRHPGRGAARNGRHAHRGSCWQFAPPAASGAMSLRPGPRDEASS